MNTHKNARLTYEGRKLLVERIAVMGLMPAAALAFGGCPLVEPALVVCAALVTPVGGLQSAQSPESA